MVPARTAFAVAFVAVAGALAFWQLSKDDERLETAPPPSALPQFATGEVSEIRIQAPGAASAMVAVRREGTWRLTTPLDDRADDGHVMRAIETLGKARISTRPVAQASASWPKLGLGNSDVLTATLRAGATELLVLHVSKDGRYARVGSAPESYELYEVERELLDRPLTQWRDRTILRFDPAQVATVAVHAGGATVRAKRIPAEPDPTGAPTLDGWSLLEGQALIQGAIDPAIPTAVVQRLAVLEAQLFAKDDTSASSAGLAQPAMSLEVVMNDGTKHVLHVGNAADKHTYVGVGGSERIWLIRSQSLDYFARAPLQWRDKSIADIQPDDVTRIDLRTPDEHIVATRTPGTPWQLVSPAGQRPDQTALDTLASAMRNLRGVAVAEGVSTRDAGLSRPSVVATFTAGADKRTLKMGKRLENNTWYATADNRTDILLLSAFTAEKFDISAASVTAK